MLSQLSFHLVDDEIHRFMKFVALGLGDECLFMVGPYDELGAVMDLLVFGDHLDGFDPIIQTLEPADLLLDELTHGVRDLEVPSGNGNLQDSNLLGVDRGGRLRTCRECSFGR